MTGTRYRVGPIQMDGPQLALPRDGVPGRLAELSPVAFALGEAIRPAPLVLSDHLRTPPPSSFSHAEAARSVAITRRPAVIATGNDSTFSNAQAETIGIFRQAGPAYSPLNTRQVA